MPCSGPSQAISYKQGDEATEEILELLRAKYHANKPGRDTSLVSDWEKLEVILRSTVRELVWTSDCEW